MPASLQIAPLEHGLVRTSGAAVDIAFQVRGTGPAVVLLHGTSANHAVWHPVGDVLAGRATVIALDQRGHGRSDKPAAGYGADDFAADVVTVLDALQIDSAVIAGHSLGGRNAWVTAARYPARVDGVVVVDYTPYVQQAVLDELGIRVDAGFRSFAGEADVEAYLRDRYGRIRPDAVVRRARWGYERDASGRLTPLASPDAMRQLIEGFRVPWDAAFRSVAVPMTHLRGIDSRIVDDSAWERAIADRPDDRWRVVDDADHYIPEEHPLLVAAEIERILGT